MSNQDAEFQFSLDSGTLLLSVSKVIVLCEYVDVRNLIQR